MEMRISNLKLKGIVVLVVDQEKGVTLVFKNDPLERVDVNSTFDSIPNIRRFLQTQIEKQLRAMFQDDLPQMVHSLSLMLLERQRMDERIAEERRQSKTRQSDVAMTYGMPMHKPNLHQLHSNHRNLSPTLSSASVQMPVHEKWSGNEPSSDYDYYNNTHNGYVLHRSLSRPSNPDASHELLGLNHLVNVKPTKQAIAAPTDPFMRYYDYPIRMRSASTARVGLSNNFYNSHSEAVFFHSQPMDDSNLLRPVFQSSAISIDEASVHHRQRSSSPTNRLTDDYDSDYAYLSSSNATDAPSAVASSHVRVLYRKGQVEEGTVWRRPLETNHHPSIATSGNPSDLSPTTYPSHVPAIRLPDTNHSPSPAPLTNGPKQKIVLRPSDNEMTAHLANLMSSNQTMSPNTHDLEHFTFRGAAMNSSIGASLSNHHQHQSHGSISTNSNGLSRSTSSTARPLDVDVSKPTIINTSDVAASRASGISPTSTSSSMRLTRSHSGLVGDAQDTASVVSGFSLASATSGRSRMQSAGQRKRPRARTVQKVRLPAGVQLPGSSRPFSTNASPVRRVGASSGSFGGTGMSDDLGSTKSE